MYDKDGIVELWIRCEESLDNYGSFEDIYFGLCFVQVPEDQTGAEDGWMGGEMNGKKGWFPKDYVEKLPEEQSSHFNAFGSAFRYYHML